MALTNIAINKAKRTDKAYRLADSGGLYLQITPAGAKCWRMKYRFLGKEKVLSLGQYPHVPLLEAREALDGAKKLLAKGQDPNEVKQKQVYEAKKEAANTFESVALEWHEKNKVKWVEKNANRNLSMLKRHVFPFIGSTPIAADVISYFDDSGSSYICPELEDYRQHLKEQREKQRAGGRKGATTTNKKWKEIGSGNPQLSRESLVQFNLAQLSQNQSLESENINDDFVKDYECASNGY